MAPRRPAAVHVADLAHQGRRLQFLATSAPDLARQVKAAAPDLPPSLVEQLARLVIERRARVELPDLLTFRHAATLAPQAPQAPPTVPGETAGHQATATPPGDDADHDGADGNRDRDPAHGATL